MKHPDLHAIIGRFTVIPTNEWLKIDTLFTKKKFKKGEYFIKEGDSSHTLGIVLSGCMRLYYQDSKGKEYTKAFRIKNHLVSAYAENLTHQPSRTWIIANQDTEMYTADLRHLEKLYDSHACWQTLGRKIAEWLYLEKWKREYELLQLSATERYKAFNDEFGATLNDIPLFQIASYLGITPVALSRLRSARGTKNRRKSNI